MQVNVNIAAVVWNLLTAASSLFQTLLQSRNWPRWWVMIIYMIIMMIIEERRSAMSTFFYLLNLIITVYFKLFMQRSIIPLVWQGGRSPEPWSLSTPQPFFIVVKIIFIYNYNLIIIMIGTSSEWIRNLNIWFVWISRSWFLDKGRVPLPNRMNFWKKSKRPLTTPHNYVAIFL